MASSGPSQKFGIEMPTSANVVAAWSTPVPALTAATTPAGIAMAQRHEHGGKRKLDGRRQPRRDGRRHRFVRPQRHAQIAARGAREERGVLNEQRPVEAEPAPQLGDALRRGGIAEHRLHRIAGNEMEAARRRASRRRAGPESRAAAGERETAARPLMIAPPSLTCPSGFPAAVISFVEPLPRDAKLDRRLRSNGRRFAPAPPGRTALRMRAARRPAGRPHPTPMPANCGGSAAGADHAPAADPHGERGQDVLQLADVARPVVAREHGDGRRR